LSRSQLAADGLSRPRRARFGVIGATLAAATVVASMLVVGTRVLGVGQGDGEGGRRAAIGSPLVIGLDQHGEPLQFDPSNRPAVPSSPAGPLIAEQPAPPVSATRSPAKASPKAASARPAPQAATVTVNGAPEAQVLALVNIERANAGCSEVTANDRLTAAARGHSSDMAARDYFSHDTPEGVSVGTRVTNTGYRWSMVGENIAWGQADAKSVMKDWMNSSGHKANILNCKYRHLGVGLAYDANRRPYWTQDFGTPM
jgi:uncharacterized protein YkwD